MVSSDSNDAQELQELTEQESLEESEQESREESAQESQEETNEEGLEDNLMDVADQLLDRTTADQP